MGLVAATREVPGSYVTQRRPKIFHGPAAFDNNHRKGLNTRHCCFGRDSIGIISMKTISTERQNVIVTYD